MFAVVSGISNAAGLLLHHQHLHLTPIHNAGVALRNHTGRVILRE
jgi:hypothetical protein